MQMSHVKVELHQCRLKMDNDTNNEGLVSKASFSKLQYRFSSVHNAAKTATYPARDHSDEDKLVTFLKDMVKHHTAEITEMFWFQIEILKGIEVDKVAFGDFSTLEDRVGIGMQISIFIATKVPEKRDKEYKSEECITSLMMAVQSITVDIFISNFTSPSMNNSRVLVRTLTGPDDSSTLPLARDTSRLWGKEHKTDKTRNVEVFFIKSITRCRPP